MNVHIYHLLCLNVGHSQKKILNYGQANGLITHPDSSTRLSANKSIYGNLGKDEEIYTSALRNICSDWVKITKRRKYDSPMHQALISNDISGEIIENLVSSIERHIPLYRRYLKLKAKILNIPVLNCSDVVAPFPDAPEMEFDWVRIISKSSSGLSSSIKNSSVS